MRKLAPLMPLTWLMCVPAAGARGVTPYLPLQLEPEMERQIERVLALGDKPVMKRPIAAALVLDALPRACAIDRALCEDVRRYLARYTRNAGITHASVGGAATDVDAVTSTAAVPNQHGLTVASAWQASANVFWQPWDHVLVALGGVAYDGNSAATGTVLSVGFDWAQLDAGYRGHWLSPFTDSSMLLSTQAITMPSVTLSNYLPLTRFGLQYEVFLAEMSRSDRILFQGSPASGDPRLFGMQATMEPFTGWSLGLSRVLQHGGGPRNNSFRDLLEAFFLPGEGDNIRAGGDPDAQFGNQAAAFSSRFLFPGKTPFAVYFEFAGEDTSYNEDFRPGNSALSAGIHLPRLWRRFDITYETSEWQNAWYVHSIYQDGLVNEGHVIGHWGADGRVFNDAVGAETHSLQLGWQPPFGGALELRYRTVENARYATTVYERGHDLTARYSRSVGPVVVGGEAFAGRDVFGESFSRVGMFFRYSPGGGMIAALLDQTESRIAEADAEIFVDAGVNANRVRVDLEYDDVRTTDLAMSPHFAIGARRAVSSRSDVGARIELDEIDGHSLVALRAIDYRYRFSGPLAFSAFLGAARYDLATPAHGLYGGIGAQWRDLLPSWDVGIDLRLASKVARDDLVPGDPFGQRPDAFYDIYSATLSISRRF